MLYGTIVRTPTKRRLLGTPTPNKSRKVSELCVCVCVRCKDSSTPVLRSNLSLSSLSVQRNVQQLQHYVQQHHTLWLWGDTLALASTSFTSLSQQGRFLSPVS